jgi:hypothetical protein
MPGDAPRDASAADKASHGESLARKSANFGTLRQEAKQELQERFKRKLSEKEQLGEEPQLRGTADEKAARFDLWEDTVGLRPLYRTLAPTKEWAENNYRHLRMAVQDANLVGPGRFWLDYAKRDPALPFRSVHFPEATRNFTEMVVALALLDLPFESPAHETAFDGGKMTVKAGGPLIAFHEETVAVDAPEKPGSILVSQNFLRQSERQEIVAGEPRDKFVSGELLTHVVYTAQVVVTNPTSSRQRISVLLQIPAGAMPVLGGKATRSVPLVLEPYNVQALETCFYFPLPGEYAHFPVHVSSGEALVAFDTTQFAALSATQVRALTTTQLGNLEAADISEFTTTQIAGLATTQVRGLTDTAVGALAATQIAALTTAQVQSLNTTSLVAFADTQIAALTTTQVASLTTTQVAALDATNVAALAGTQVAALTAAQVVSLGSTNFSLLDATQVTALTTTQMKSLTTTQVANIDAAQVASFSTTQLTSLNATQIKSLSTTNLSTLDTTQMASLSATQIAALTTTQVAGLAAGDIGEMTTTQVQSLVTTQMGACPWWKSWRLAGPCTGGCTP